VKKYEYLIAIVTKTIFNIIHNFIYIFETMYMYIFVYKEEYNFFAKPIPGLFDDDHVRYSHV